MPISEAADAFDIVVVPFSYSDRLAEKRRPGAGHFEPGAAPVRIAVGCHDHQRGERAMVM
jgi:hypothetical protein